VAGERARWTADRAAFAETRNRLVGDAAVASAFVSYAGPFNHEFRDYMVTHRFIADLKKRGVPVTPALSVTNFLVDRGTVS
jgi:dynein heavy chain